MSSVSSSQRFSRSVVVAGTLVTVIGGAVAVLTVAQHLVGVR